MNKYYVVICLALIAPFAHALECSSFTPQTGAPQDPGNAHSLISDTCINSVGNTWTLPQPFFIHEPVNSSPYTVTNAGTISGAGNSIEVYTNSVVDLVNTGSISSTLGQVIYVDSNAVLTIDNSGSITSNDRGINNFGTINNFINTGTISALQYDVANHGTITILSNGQGGNISSNSSTPLYYSDRLPATYKIILGSTGSYGILNVASVNHWDGDVGLTTFGIYDGSSVKAQKYSAVISGVSSDYLDSSSLTGTFGSYNYQLALEDGQTDIWDLLFLNFGPLTEDTQASLRYQARQLRSAFNTQSAVANFALNYDCNMFDTYGLCISAGGRYTSVENPNVENSAAVVTLGYKVNPNFRVGAYLDQNVSISDPNGIQISNNTPLAGIYAVWNQVGNGTGFQLRLANTYQDKDITSTRTIFNTSEAGRGTSSLNSQNYLAELSYSFLHEDKTTVRSYIGLRYSLLKNDGYREKLTGLVIDPLNFSSIYDKSASVLMGVKVNHSFSNQFSVNGQLGIEQDAYHKVSDYSASDLNASELTPISFNSNIKRTRPVASVGAYYDLTKAQRISATLNYQQLAFQSTGSASAYINYLIGF